MKINVGLANYGSIGSNCNTEFEADQSVLRNDETLRR